MPDRRPPDGGLTSRTRGLLDIGVEHDDSTADATPGALASDDAYAEFEVRAVVESVATARERVASWLLNRLCLSGEQLHAAKLVVSEAVTNVVLHAYPDGRPGPVRVRAQSEGSRVVLLVEDQGVGVRPRLDSPGLGMGLPLIARLAHSMEVISTPPRTSGTEVRVTLPV